MSSSRATHQSQCSKTALLNKLEDNIITIEPCDVTPVSIGAPETIKVNKMTRRKKNKLVRINSSKHETSLDLIKEDVDEIDYKASGVQSENIAVSSVEQHRRSPHRKLPRQVELDASDSDEDVDDANVKLTLDTKPLANKKKSRNLRSARLLALHKKLSEDYDGDYEDEVATPSVDLNPTRHFNNNTTMVEVHNPITAHDSVSPQSAQDVGSSDDRVKLLATNSTLSPPGLSHSAPSLHQYNKSPKRNRSDSTMKLLKFTFPENLSHHSYESAV